MHYKNKVWARKVSKVLNKIEDDGLFKTAWEYRGDIAFFFLLILIPIYPFILNELINN